MGIKAAIFGAAGIVMILSWLATWQVGKAYLAERDKTVELLHTAEINEIERKAREEKEAAVAAVREEYNIIISQNETANEEKLNELTRALVTAREDAAQSPIEFGDSLMRNIIRLDCLWSKGAAGNSVQGRAACDSEAERADPASAGFSFAVITPTFLETWRDACSDWESIGTATGDVTYDKDEWQAEYANFDVALCHETLVALTPEFSLYMNRFIENGRAYTGELLEWGREQSEMIDILSKQPTQ